MTRQEFEGMGRAVVILLVLLWWGWFGVVSGIGMTRLGIPSAVSIFFATVAVMFGLSGSWRLLKLTPESSHDR